MLFEQDMINKKLQPVKKSQKGITVMLITALCLFVNVAVFAQSVNISINIIPPYSPYYSDYSGINASKVFLVLQNLANTQQKIKLVGKLQGDNGVLITTYSNYTPLQPIVLNPREVRQLNGTALKDIFDLNNLSVSGVDKAKLGQSTRIPEGNYSLCVQAVDYNGRNALSPNAPSGCTSINITYPEPPILVNPAPGEKVIATTPQTIVFTWINAGSVPVGTQYTIQLAQMPDVAADPNQVLNATSFPMLSQTVAGSSYIYGPANLPLTTGKKYAWRIIASDPSGKTLFKNNGISPASMFEYDSQGNASGGGGGHTMKKMGTDIQVSGIINFQYHSGTPPPAPFTGIKSEQLPLANEAVQLCYGQVRVNMDLTKHYLNPADSGKKVLEIKGKNKGYGRTQPPNYVIDTIRPYGVPSNPIMNHIEPAGLSFNGLGEVIATTTTNASGGFTFKATTTKSARIVETYSDKTALIYCYYINIKNKHYTDPITYIYIPKSSDSSFVDIGATGVFVNNYNLTVTVNRDLEFSTNQANGQGVSIENKADSTVNIYVLRKQVIVSGIDGNGKTAANSKGSSNTHERVSEMDKTAPNVPKSEGDNSGHVVFASQSPSPPNFTKFGNYEIIAKRTVKTTNQPSLYDPNNFRAVATFSNLVDNLDNTEDYMVYAEYKNASAYVDEVPYSYQPYNEVSEYNPKLGIANPNNELELTPSFVSIKVKGVLKYQFKDGIPAPLANVSVSLKSLAWVATFDADGKKISGVKQFDYTNPDDQTFGTTTTDNNGYFEIDAGNIAYNKYIVGHLADVIGISQFITVNNFYYGSPDTEYDLTPGNTYNLGEVIAKVKEYTLRPKIETLLNSKNTALPGQRVYLCRLANVNPHNWGVPADEGVQQNAPQKQIKDINGTVYNVINYGLTDASGYVTFNRLVTKDFGNDDDQYYIYSESGVISELNYSTQNGLLASLLDGQNYLWPYYYPTHNFVFNSVFSGINFVTSKSFKTVPLAPYIDGGVYPFSNTSTNALPGVLVKLYNINGKTKKQVEGYISSLGLDNALILMTGAGIATFNDSQTTGSDPLFYFGSPSTTAWSLLVYSKAGFVSNYTPVNAGMPMANGVKENVKGFLMPPQLVHATVKDAVTGNAVAANIVVGGQFSWGYQAISPVFLPGKPAMLITQGVNLTAPYGKMSFTVIPDDNVHYRTQNFEVSVTQTTDPQPGVVTQTLAAFNMQPNENRINVCIHDAITNKPLAGIATILDIPDAINPAPGGGIVIPAGKCTEFDFASNVPFYRVRVTSPGYATLIKTVYNNTNIGYAQGCTFAMEKGMTIAGNVRVDDKEVAGAKVYIQEMPDLPAVYTDQNGKYTISGLPINNQQISLTAVDASLNAIGQIKSISLNLVPDPSENSGQGSNGNRSRGGAQNNNGVITFTAPEVNTQTSTKNIHFALSTSSEFDLSNLYGFPLEVESIGGALQNIYLTGRIKVPVNAVFNIAHEPYLHFTKIKINTERRDGTTAKLPVKPLTPMVHVDDDDVDITVFGKYTAQIRGFSTGIQIAPDGVVGGTVALNPTAVAQNIQLDNELTLEPLNTKPTLGTPVPLPVNVNYKYKAVESEMPVFVANNATSGKEIPQYFSLSCSNGVGPARNGVHYLLNNIYGTDGTGYLTADGLHLNSVIHTGLQNVAQPDIALNIGEVVVNDHEMKEVLGTSAISIPLDTWSIKSSKWFIASGALTLDGIVNAGGITVPFTGMQISSNNIGFANLNLQQIAIAGALSLHIDTAKTMTSFGYDKAAEYGTQYDKQYGCWSLSLLPKDSGQPLVTLGGLPDMGANDYLTIMNVSLYSKGGESRIVLDQNQPSVTLNGIAAFQPSEIENGSDYFKINGALNFTIPGFTGTENTAYSLDYTNNGGVLVHHHNPISGLKLTTNGIRVDFDTNGQVFTNGTLGLRGYLQDKVSNSPYKFAVNFTDNSSGATIAVRDSTFNVISLGPGQQMSKISGGMTLTNQQWNNFDFEGDIGATGMDTAKLTHIGFEVKGDLVANKAAIGVQNMDLPGGLGQFSLTYDFDKKAIIGSMHIDNINTPIADASADLELQLGSGKWYILGAVTISKLTLPLPLNGASAAFLIGYTDITPDMLQIIAPVFHDGVLPTDFNTNFQHLKGSLFVLGVDMGLPLIGSVDLDLGIADVHINDGIYANAYLGLTFDSPSAIKVLGGLKVGAYINIGAGASLGLVCAGVSLSAEVNVQANIVMDNLEFTDLNPISFYKQSSLTLEMGPQVLLAGEAYVGAGICNSSCHSVKVWGVTVPPGCFKKSLSGDLNLNMQFTIKKPSGTLTPNEADAKAHLFGHDYSTQINL